jgi:hypothetical protein
METFPVGDNLSGHENLEFFTGASPEEIKSQLMQIRTPFKIISMYSTGGSHIVWFRSTNKIIKKIKTKKLGENNNGNSNSESS